MPLVFDFPCLVFLHSLFPYCASCSVAVVYQGLTHVPSETLLYRVENFDEERVQETSSKNHQHLIHRLVLIHDRAFSVGVPRLWNVLHSEVSCLHQGEI